MTSGIKITSVTIPFVAASALGNATCQEPMPVKLDDHSKKHAEAVLKSNPSDTQGSAMYQPVAPISVQSRYKPLPKPWWYAKHMSEFERLIDKMPNLEDVLHRARSPLELAFGAPITASLSIRQGKLSDDLSAVVMVDYDGDRTAALRKLRNFEKSWLFEQEDEELDNVLFYIANE